MRHKLLAYTGMTSSRPRVTSSKMYTGFVTEMRAPANRVQQATSWNAARGSNRCFLKMRSNRIDGVFGPSELHFVTFKPDPLLQIATTTEAI